MQYLYEALGPDRFQELCQALIARDHSNSVSFPIGKKDGGRDAAVPREFASQDVTVFQVKYHHNPRPQGDAASLLIRILKEELPKVRRLRDNGATKYVLMTNLSPTAALEVGEHDRVSAYLAETYPLPASVLWREDIDARLNNAYDVRWAFSEIIRGSDLLRQLIEEGFDETRNRRDLAVLAYLATQYEQDETVKFKQADLQASDLLSLFIDVPAGAQAGQGTKRERETALLIHEANISQQNTTSSTTQAAQSPNERIGAASLFLSATGQKSLDFAVLEGGPGQGKSTLAQYICQVHRTMLLKTPDEIARLPETYRNCPTRVPFKVDLRDLSSWLRKINPFAADTAFPEGVSPSLETFLAAQVSTLSGGSHFTVDDLRLFLQRVPAFVVLDGLDEIATLVDRETVIEAVEAARTRFASTAPNVHLLVTSRPAATASTPRFNGKDWHYLDLHSITEELIYDYLDRWAKSRQLKKADVADIEATLRARLNSPHIRDLARNAMQLTILLQLIHTRGVALPDQRTQLYDRYVELFFNREAEKNPVVRDNRQLLIDIHGYVAWKIHSAAQGRRTNGRVTEQELRQLITDYMTSRGHNTNIVESLFHGVVQRIVALVSRVVGTYEFEVQPLREYFAARHLYDTAPYSPVGDPQTGTKPEILETIAPQPYWHNVTRFFAGCYSVGELPGLADQICELVTSSDLSRTSYSRLVATSVLRDRVFQQSPKVTTSVVNASVGPLTFRYATAGVFGRTDGPVLDLPSDCGRSKFLAELLDRALTARAPALRFESALTARYMFPPQDLEPGWRSHRPSETESAEEHLRWINNGAALGLIGSLDEGDIAGLAASSARLKIALARGGAASLVEEPDVQASLVRECLDGTNGGLPSQGQFGWLMNLLDFRHQARLDPRVFRSRFADHDRPPRIVDPVLHQLAVDLDAIYRTSRRGEMPPEAALIVEALDGRSWLAWKLAILTLSARSTARDLRMSAASLSDADDVIAAAASARVRQAAPGWWSATMAADLGLSAKRAVAAMALLWATPSVLEEVAPLLDSILRGMSAREYEDVHDFVLLVQRSGGAAANLTSRAYLGLVRENEFSLRTQVALTTRSTEEVTVDTLMSARENDLFADPVILLKALEAVVLRTLGARPEDQGNLLESARRLFKHSRFGIGFGVSRSRSSLSRASADLILGDADGYPLDLVTAADTVLTGRVITKRSVATIARTRGWAAG